MQLTDTNQNKRTRPDQDHLINVGIYVVRMLFRRGNFYSTSYRILKGGNIVFSYERIDFLTYIVAVSSLEFGQRTILRLKFLTQIRRFG
uniref:Uncharacterized protein n=1 Tax=Romanomermis culicivorax TaxID=13658 RepID=A0A915HRC7_ROMCU